jgi:hypothetical protein
MALLYSKSELEAIAQRLQCCAADAAGEALAGEVFLDHAKKTCGWNKFKFLKRAVKILSEYVPGGTVTSVAPFAIENTIDPTLDGTYSLKDAAIVEDILSPYYGFSFIVFGNNDGDTHIYIIYDGELYFVMDSSMYTAPYMQYIESVTYDNDSDVLVLGANGSIQEYDLSTLLLPVPVQPIAISSTSYPGVAHDYAAYNRIENTVFFSNTIASEVRRFYTFNNSVVTIPVGSTPSHIAVNSSNGQTWVVCGTIINVINTYAIFVSSTINLGTLLGATSIEKLIYSRQLDLFIIPYFDGFQYKLALLNPNGSVYSQSIYTTINTIGQGLYYQQLDKYFVAEDTVVININDSGYYYIDVPRIMLNDTKYNKIVVASNTSEFAENPLRIMILSAIEDEDTLCLTDNDVQNIIETAQHHCCDCCPAPIIYLDGASFSQNPAVDAAEEVTPAPLYTIYYGSSVIDGLGKLDPLELLTLTSVNRYQYPGIYQYYLNTFSYLYYAIPSNIGAPTGFFNAVTGTTVSMNLPYKILLNGVWYSVYKSASMYSNNITLQII